MLSNSERSFSHHSLEECETEALRFEFEQLHWEKEKFKMEHALKEAKLQLEKERLQHEQTRSSHRGEKWKSPKFDNLADLTDDDPMVYFLSFEQLACRGKRHF